MFKVFFNVDDAFQYLMAEGFPDAIIYDIGEILILLPMDISLQVLLMQ
jgi:hypothetical protein